MTLMPLSRYGLCDADIITPAANGPVRVTCAMPGVVISPAKRALTPRLAKPPATDPAIDGPDSRVSIPMTTSGSTVVPPTIGWSLTQLRQRHAHSKRRGNVERVLARDAAHSISSKKLSHVGVIFQSVR